MRRRSALTWSAAAACSRRILCRRHVLRWFRCSPARRIPPLTQDGGRRQDAGAPQVCDDMTIEVALSVMASARTGHLLVRDNDGLCTQLVTQVQLAAVRDGSAYTDRVQLRDILGDRGPFPSPVTSMAEAEHFRPASRRRGPPACSVPFPLASDAAAGSARDRARAPGPAAESPATACPDLLGPVPFIDSRTPLLVRSNGKRAMTQRMVPHKEKERRGMVLPR